MKRPTVPAGGPFFIPGLQPLVDEDAHAHPLALRIAQIRRPQRVTREQADQLAIGLSSQAVRAR
jgi:hypothetical protein